MERRKLWTPPPAPRHDNAPSNLRTAATSLRPVSLAIIKPTCHASTQEIHISTQGFPCTVQRGDSVQSRPSVSAAMVLWGGGPRRGLPHCLKSK
ncbi:hypothetical protein E2C01_015917 [Portunus trituberculatus]|uniref:Uncharacterized protein n=1 Tax=Portunus trituberculatus TaxID=210409 RepID=A0A5B7DN66_PORTR|nr:hypothetical protein [Portunus trituberculatus]